VCVPRDCAGVAELGDGGEVSSNIEYVFNASLVEIPVKRAI
jgi:hypothetical protein